MDNRRPLLASWRNARRSILTQSSRLLSGAALAAVSPQVALGARKNDRREDDERAKDDEREKRRDEDQNGGSSDNGANENAVTKTENQDSHDKTERRERREDRAADEDDAKSESKGDENRSVSRRQDADAQANDDESDGGNDRQTREFAQRNRDGAAAEDTSADPPVTSSIAPSNPNVVLDDVPDLSEAELVIEANPDVIASVSTSGGFAFARSGNVIAFSGPDGARIIQTDAPETDSFTSPVPDDPDDGGNNDVEFSS